MGQKLSSGSVANALTSGSVKSLKGQKGIFDQKDFEIFKDKVVTKCGIVITPFQQRETIVDGLVSTSEILATAASVVSQSCGKKLKFVEKGTRVCAQFLTKKMYNFSAYLEIDQRAQIIFCYGKNGLTWDFSSYFMQNYRMLKDNDGDHPSQHTYNFIHKQLELMNVIQMYQVKSQVLFSEVLKVMASNKEKNYNIIDWNSKDYTNSIVNVLKMSSSDD